VKFGNLIAAAVYNNATMSEMSKQGLPRSISCKHFCDTNTDARSVCGSKSSRLITATYCLEVISLNVTYFQLVYEVISFSHKLQWMHLAVQK